MPFKSVEMRVKYISNALVIGMLRISAIFSASKRLNLEIQLQITENLNPDTIMECLISGDRRQ